MNKSRKKYASQSITADDIEKTVAGMKYKLNLIIIIIISG